MEKIIKIEIQIKAREQGEILIAELSEIGFYAFVEGNSADESSTFGNDRNNILDAYIYQEAFDEKRLQEILPGGAGYLPTIIDSRNWNEEWESSFKPVCISSFVGIRASFHKPMRDVQHEIVITPKMSFGTGHHATTFLMIEQMKNIDFKNKTVIDFGTGTGILAILAEKLGAKKVVGIDNDEWSINNATENINKNNCARITLEKAETVKGFIQPDIILANISLNILLRNVIELSSISQDGCILLMSGFLDNNKKAILNCFNSYGFAEILSSKKENWVSLRLIKR